MTSCFSSKYLKISSLSLLIFLAMATSVFQKATANERLEVPSFKVFGTPASEADKEAVNKLLADFQSAWAKQDTAAIMKMYSSDIEWINAYARMFRGHDELAVFLEDTLFPNFPKSVSKGEINNMEPISLRFLGDNVAVFHGYTDGKRGKSVLKDRKYRRTHFHFVMEKQGDEWLFVHKAISDARDNS